MALPTSKAVSFSLQSTEEEPDVSEPPTEEDPDVSELRTEETDAQSAASPLERPQRRSITSYTVVPSGT